MGKKLSKLAVRSWANYEYKGHGGDIRHASRSELEAIVRKAAKAANQRLVRLERAGETGGVYKMAMHDLGIKKRRRYRERTQGLSMTALRNEYGILRDFLSAKTSTVQGLRDTRDKRYQTAKARGFQGSAADWDKLVRKYFSKENERLFSSDVVYSALTSGETGGLDDIIKMDERLRKQGAGGVTPSIALQMMMSRRIGK